MKLLALDGNSIINRAFYGIKLLTTKDGQFTNGIYGFINILNRLIEKEHPDAVAVAFDVHHPTFRHEKYTEYKAGRKGMPDELRSQMPILKEWLSLMGYACIEKPGFEADDILGTLSRVATDSGNTCVIATGDRDSLQLVSDSTRVLLTATKAGHPELTDYTVDAVYEKYGMAPKSLIELKALMGDSSDNIPGVAGVGEKTATELIKSFGSIDYIYQNLENLDIRDTLKNKLSAGKEKAFLSRELGTIYCEVPVSSDFSAYIQQEPDINRVVSLMTRLEFFKLMENMGLHAENVVTEEKETKGTVKAVSAEQFTADGTVDIYPDNESGRIGIVSNGTVCDLSFSDNLPLIKRIFENENIKKRVYDSKNLYKLCASYGITLSSVEFDSLLAGYLANPSASSYDVSRLTQEYFVESATIDGDSYEFIETAVNHSAVTDKLLCELEKSGQAELLSQIELPLARVLAEMELQGFLIDFDGIKSYGDTLKQRIDVIEKEIYALVGYEFNLNSPKQLGVALFEDLGLPAGKKTKSGYSTSAEVLEGLRDAHPSINLLLEYRRLAKLKSTYCDGLCAAVGKDGRIHSTFNQTETRTGRISSLEPNLQNIPVRTPEGAELRKYFIAKDGYTLCDADYSQIELRVLAHMSNDRNMLEQMNSGLDFHTAAASTAFDIPIELVTPVLRSRAKAVNFGIVYGIGAFSLSKDIGVTKKEADQYIKSYLSAYSGVDNYMKNVIESAKVDGYVTTLFGRRRYLPELSSSNHMLRAFGERVARNAPIQGTAADIIKIAMVRVYDRLKREKLDAKLILQVHDELIVECREDIKDYICRILVEEMQASADMKVKLTVDANWGKTWFVAKG